MAFFNPFKKNEQSSLSSGLGRLSLSGGEASASGPQSELGNDYLTGTRIGAIEVTEVSSGIGVVYEETAVLYANGNEQEAEQLLTTVFDDPNALVGEGLWMMLLDLYRLTGQKDRFEARVIDYARRFERSPPAWEDLSIQAGRRPSDASALLNLPPVLAAAAARQFQQICIIGRSSGKMRIDLGRVRSIDDAGCALFRQTLAQLNTDRVQLTIANAVRLIDLLLPRIKTGEPTDRDYWMLVLEMLKYTGDSTRFEDMAVDYAITFEESPPSWESKTPVAAEEEKPEESPADVIEGAFVFDGELTGSSSDTIKQLEAFATSRQTVLVDCSALRRVDFVAAGTLFNALAALQAHGKQLQLHRVNAMVGALMRVMSIDQVAQVTLRG